MERVVSRDAGSNVLGNLPSDINAAFDSQAVQSLATSKLGSFGSTLSTAGINLDGWEGCGQCCTNIKNFVKYDIILAFVQQIGLWFDNFQLPQGFKDAWAGFMQFVSLMWTFIAGITELMIFYAWSGISCLLFIIWLFQKTGDPVKEIQGPNTYGWEKRGKVWLFWTKILVTLLTTLYMPTMNSVFKVVFCNPAFMNPYELTCYDGDHWGHLAFALVVLLFIGLYLPFVVYQVIRDYQPQPQSFDSEGNYIDIVNDRKAFLNQYRDLMNHDDCPYAFLYSGYEYSWSAYKVIVMIIKMLLVIPCIPLITSQLVSVSVSMLIVLIYTIISTITRPFLLDTDDWIDISARATSLLTLIMQILVLTNVIPTNYASIILLILHIVNLVVMAVLIVSTIDFLKEFFRNRWGNLVFTNKMDYDIEISRKNCVWQRFWRALLASDDNTKPAYARLLELDDIVKRVGKKAYRSGLYPPNREIAQLRRLARELEGVDVYYRGSVTDKTYWGRMYIKPFPFICVVVYDSTEKSVEIHDHNIKEFVEQNMKDPEILNGRRIRRALRCLDGEMVHYECDIPITPIGGASCGLLPVTCHCSYGYLHIEKRSNDPYCHGFKVKIDFYDGVYTDRTGKVHKNQHAKIKNKDLKIDKEFKSTPEILKLINDKNNLYIIESKWDDLHERLRFFREDLEQERDDGENDLSYSFWMLIYNNHHLPREELDEFLKTYEKNPYLQTIMQDKKNDFDSLYSRLEFFDSHPAISYWYTFWDDVFILNSKMKKIKKYEELFSLTSEKAIAYHPVSIPRLKENLEMLGLRKSNGKGLFNDKVLDKLEQKLQENNSKTVNYNKISYIKPIDQSILFDPRCASTILIPENATFIAQAAMLAWNGKE